MEKKEEGKKKINSDEMRERGIHRVELDDEGDQGVKRKQGYEGSSMDVRWSVYIGKGVCNAVESSRGKSQMELAAGVKRQEEDEWC